MAVAPGSKLNNYSRIFFPYPSRGAWFGFSRFSNCWLDIFGARKLSENRVSAKFVRSNDLLSLELLKGVPINPNTSSFLLFTYFKYNFSKSFSNFNISIIYMEKIYSSVEQMFSWFNIVELNIWTLAIMYDVLPSINSINIESKRFTSVSAVDQFYRSNGIFFYVHN